MPECGRYQSMPGSADAETAHLVRYSRVQQCLLAIRR